MDVKHTLPPVETLVMPGSGLEESIRWIADTGESSMTALNATHDCKGRTDGSLVGTTHCATVVTTVKPCPDITIAGSTMQ